MFHKEPNLLDQRTEMAFIPPGKYIAIDEDIYEPKPRTKLMTKNKSYQPVDNFKGINQSYESQIPQLTIPSQNLKVNYGMYLYNQITSNNGNIFV